MAAYAIQFRRGTTTQHSSFTGLLGEVTVDTDKKTLVVHDGSTTGGFPLAREGAASTASTGTFTSNVTVGGTFSVTSTASFGDDVTITGDLGMTGHIIPSANITYDLGSSTMMWRDIYVGPGSLYVNGKKVIEDNSGTIQITTDANQNLKVETTGTGTLQLSSAAGIAITGELNAATGDIQVGDHIDMNSNRIKEVSAPVDGTDAANKNYVDTTAAGLVSGGTLSFDGVNGDFSGNVAIGGNLIVTGTTTTVNTATLSVADNIIDLNSDVTSGTPSENAGLRVLRGDESAVQIRWNETSDKWEFTNDGSTYKSLDSYGDSDVDTYLYTTDQKTFRGRFGAASGSNTVNYLAGSLDVGGNGNYIKLAGSGTSPSRFYVRRASGVDADFDILSYTSNDEPELNAAVYRPALEDGTQQSNLNFEASGNAEFTLGGYLDVNGSRIVGLAEPTGSNNAATKAYVDNAVAGKDNTDEITEGSTNLYYTDARVDARLASGSLTSIDTGNFSVSSTGALFDVDMTFNNGTTNVFNIDASTGDTTIGGTTVITGGTTINNTFDVSNDVTFSGDNLFTIENSSSTSIFAVDVTNNSTTIATALNVNNNIAITEGDLSITNSSSTNVFDVDVTASTFNIALDATFNNTVNVANDFTVTNSSSTNLFDIDVANTNLAIDLDMTVNNSATFNNNIAINNSSSTTLVDIDVANATYAIDMDLTVNNASTFNNNLTINNSSSTAMFDIDVTNATAVFNTDLTVNNDVNIVNSSSTNVFAVDVTNTTFDIDLALTQNNTSTFNNDITINNTSSTQMIAIDVTNATYDIDMDLTVNNATVVNNNLTVNNTTATTAIFDIDVANTTVDIDASLTVSNNVTFDNDITFNIDNSSSVTVFSVNGSTGATTINGLLSAGSDVTISGNLTVSGTTTTVNTETINLADNIILLNSNATGTASQNGGIEIERGDSLNVQFLWDETNDRWTVGSEELYSAGGFIGNLTGDVTGTVSSLSNHDTDDLAEGTNLYWTAARGNANFATNLAASDTDDLSEGASNLYYTTARVNSAFDTRLATKDTDNLSEGTTNLYYTDARWDTKMAAADTDDLGEGTTNLYYTDARATTNFASNLAAADTDDLSEGTTNLYYTDTRWDTKMAAADTDDLSEGASNLYYTAARDNANWTSNMAAADTDDLSEGTTNLYFTDARVRSAISVTDAGGDGSLAYNSATGVLTYTGPSASEVRAHFTAGTGISITNGVIANTQVEDYVASAAFNTSTGVLTLTRQGGATVTADLDGRYMSASSAFTYAHSSVQTVTAAVATSNASGAVTYDFNELEGAIHYTVYLNRQLLRPGEFSVNTASTTANLTISTGILATDDELEVVTLKAANQS